ncbi:MAG: hypothetical protein B5766_00615 [Candidatus Lumbricidophila eiseniae]|uniref:DUF445 domain-containing protein n=1 Tax=Candidatus Lumbricidiphila eiseniae TaxID=1969409 RepID=A0A2A6FV28_9MICO|nr:MAG: hypothetical protein B5766_00615 [Candidatus Lumbricidophila eiseniae]
MSTREAQQSEPAHPSNEPSPREPRCPRDDPPGRPRARPRITDADRASALRRMKRLATALFVFATIVFAVSFALQEQIPWVGYIRASAEGAMVGAIADWFAVTALFRHPCGVPIPHTAIIPTRKNQIGDTLGAFVEHEFLSDEVVLGKLASLDVAHRLGDWLSEPANAERVTAEVAHAARGILTMLGDNDIEELIEQLARRYLFEPEWAPPLGRLGARLVAAHQQRAVIDMLLDRAESWLVAHPAAFGAMVSDRLPRWMPRIVDRFVDNTAHREILAFVRTVQAQPEHPLRLAVDRYLAELSDDLQRDPTTVRRVEAFKYELLESPRLREFVGDVWASVKANLEQSLGESESELRRGIRSALSDVGARLSADDVLAGKVNAWVMDAATYAVRRYRREIANIISETVERWDPRETTDKLELQVGRDLQFIRINGTVVGALAGVTIFALATGLHGLFG